MTSYPALQQSIREAISRPDFCAALPFLSDQTWMRILTFTPQARAENERLEFLGDALMYATIGRQLYAQIPNGSPHLYTSVRAALHSNMTFAMLAEKLDIMAVSNTVLEALTRKTFGEGTAAPVKSRPQIKATADLFETVIGAYYLDHGFEALYEWVREIYTPLIKTAADAFYAGKSRPAKRHRCQDPNTFKEDWASKAKQLAQVPKRQKLLLTPTQQRKRVIKKIKAADAARRSSSLKISMIGSSSPRSKSMTVPANVLPEAASSKPVNQASSVAKKAPIVIDLTLDSDSERESQQVVFHHPLVTPRIFRPYPAVSKRPTPALVIIPVAETGGESNSELEDETMLENMLTADDAISDVDCGSSDVKTPTRPSNLA
ncbi:ribonuclease III domain-containing protein [Trametes punicea]|nr:ribonuclease III domain-containing protein [Trametes punicea]